MRLMFAVARSGRRPRSKVVATTEDIMESTMKLNYRRLALCAVAVSLCATQALAADRAALQEAKRGGLSNEQAQFDRNRLARCDNQPPQDRAECVRRMNEGTTSGSVEGGGIYRELVTPVAPSKRE